MRNIGMTLNGYGSASRISALISDVDGTLVTDDKILSERTLAAVDELRSAGIAFAIISSRPPRGLRGLIDLLHITTPIAGFNGGVIVAPDASVIEEHVLSPEIARHAAHLLSIYGIEVWLFSEADWLVRGLSSPYINLEKRSVGFEPTIVDEFGDALDCAYKIVGVSDDVSLLSRCEGDIRAIFADRASVARSQRYYLDITHLKANKGSAVLTLAKLLAIPAAEIAVIGDGANDIAMFERSGLSIAMGNAAPEVQLAANLGTESNQEEGFAMAVERFILGGAHSTGVCQAQASSPPRGRLEIMADGEALARRAAEWLLALAVAKSGVFAVALSGGTTPRRLYELLAEPQYREAFPWDRTHWFWGDERFVPWSDQRSNYRMVREALLARAPIPAANIHPIDTNCATAEAAAVVYENTLKSFYGASCLDSTRPLFDATLLGLGPDGHTASLFPGSSALQERNRWVAAVLDGGPEPRITLTYPVLESSRCTAFLVAGTDKREMFQRLRSGDQQIPAARLRPLGAVCWFVDKAAVAA
jgi:6-phosphogluconolactonase